MRVPGYEANMHMCLGMRQTYTLGMYMYLPLCTVRTTSLSSGTIWSFCARTSYWLWGVIHWYTEDKGRNHHKYTGFLLQMGVTGGDSAWLFLCMSQYIGYNNSIGPTPFQNIRVGLHPLSKLKPDTAIIYMYIGLSFEMTNLLSHTYMYSRSAP